MEEQFWQARWREGRIGFHEGAPNDMLVRHLNRLNLNPSDRIFVPLCGKTVDLDWLLAQGFQVVGAEFNRSAVEAVFERLGVQPDVSHDGALECFSHGALTLFVGDVFQLDAAQLGKVSAVYDRAALVALPAETRPAYANHIAQVTETAPQLIVSFDYDHSRMQGPPFSVTADEIAALTPSYRAELLERLKLTDRMAERCGGFEEAWLLTPV